MLSSSPSNLSRSRFLLPLIIAQLATPVSSSSCYYDPVNGRICEGMSYGARLAIAAAVTILGALVLTGISLFVRKRFYGASVPPPFSAGYHGPAPVQTSYPPNGMYPHQPNVYPAAPTYAHQPNAYPDAPTYAPPPGPPPPWYNPNQPKESAQP